MTELPGVSFQVTEMRERRAHDMTELPGVSFQVTKMRERRAHDMTELPGVSFQTEMSTTDKVFSRKRCPLNLSLPWLPFYFESTPNIQRANHDLIALGSHWG